MLMFKTVLIFFLVLIASTADAASIIVSVQSVDVPPYSEVLSGFQKVCRSEIQRFVLSDLKGGEVHSKITALSPNLILAIGPDGLQTAVEMSPLPIVYVMVLNPEPIKKEARNITGIRMAVSQEKQLESIKKAIPGISRIGLVYDPQLTGQIVTQSKLAGETARIQISALPVKTSKEVPSAISGLASIPEAWWLIPDLTVITPVNLEFIANYAMSHKIPLVTFSEKYLSIGAFMSISSDLTAMGGQAGEMANAILSGKSPSQLPETDAQKAVVTINKTIAGKLGIPISESALSDFHFID
jgi:putative tryptophan/tyrosine transport system substrate-binding protein